MSKTQYGYVYRVHHKNTLWCSNFPTSLSLSKFLAMLLSPLPPCGLFELFYFSYVCVHAMCDCRLLLPVLARTLEEMFNLNDDYYFQLTNSSCLAF